MYGLFKRVYVFIISVGIILNVWSPTISMIFITARLQSTYGMMTWMCRVYSASGVTWGSKCILQNRSKRSTKRSQDKATKHVDKTSILIHYIVL